MSRWFVLLASCSAPAAPPAQPVEPPLFTIHGDTFGPFTKASTATLAALRAALPGFEVAPSNNDGLEYVVTDGDTHLFDIIPDHDAHPHILDIFIVTPKIEIAGSPWRAGATLQDLGAITDCECWADQPVCFRAQEHVAIALSKVCREGSLATPAGRQSLVGQTIRATIWSPRPLAPGGF